MACVQIPSTQVKDTCFNDIPRISVLEGVAVAVGRSWSQTGPSRQMKSSKFSERPCLKTVEMGSDRRLLITSNVNL